MPIPAPTEIGFTGPEIRAGQSGRTGSTMATVLGVLTGFSVIVVLIAVGYVVGRWQIAGPHAEGAINRLAFFVASPALLFTVLAEADVHSVFSGFLLVSVVATALVATLFVVVSALLLRMPASETTIGAASASYVNTANIGLPIAVYVIGDAQFVAPVMLFQLVVVAPVLVSALDLTSRGRVSLRAVLLQPLRNPVILGSVAGVIVAVSDLDIPEIVLAPVETIGNAGVPLILLSFGMSLHGSRVLGAGGNRVAILVAAALKSVAMPGIAYLLAEYAFALPAQQVAAATVIAALPTAQKIYGYAARYEQGVLLARDTIFVTTALSLPVIFALALLLGLPR